MTVMIGIDLHKRSHTAVALDEHDDVLDQIRITADKTQVRRLLAWAQRGEVHQGEYGVLNPTLVVHGASRLEFASG